MSSRPSYYESEEWAEFDDTLRAAAERHGVELLEAEAAAGLWEGESEPSGAYVVTAGDRAAIRGWAGELAGRYNQDSVMVGFYDLNGSDTLYGFGGSEGVDPVDIDAAISVLRAAGISGGRVRGGRLEVASTGDSPVGPAALRVLAGRFGGATQDRAVVEFVEKSDSFLSHQPIKEIQAIRQVYADEHRLPRRRPIPHLTDVDDIAAAEAYETMAHDPQHPKVVRSYRVFRQHVRQQWDALTAAGYRFEPWTQDVGQPYESSAEMLADLRDNRHLYFFRTDVSQSTAGALPLDHPMTKMVTVSTADGVQKSMVANDVFRAVHDAIAHSEGHQFGPYGEKRAWWTHRSSLPSEARLALWCETRGQNTWTNAGPHMRATTGPPRLLRRDDPEYLPVSQRPYAEQKCGLVDAALI